MLEILVLSMTTACLSFTISESAVFKPFRTWLAYRSAVGGKLVCCGYCLGHWIALPLVLIYDPAPLLSRSAILDLCVTVLCVAWLAGLQWIMMCALAAWSGR